MSDPFFAVAGEKVDNGNFYHRVASRLLLHGSACHAYQYLCGQCGVVDTHIKFEQLVLCFAGYTFAWPTRATNADPPVSPATPAPARAATASGQG